MGRRLAEGGLLSWLSLYRYDIRRLDLASSLRGRGCSMNLNVVRRRQWWASMGSPSSTDGTTLLYVDALPNCQPGKDDARPCHLAQLSAFRWGSHAHRWPSRVNANKSDRLRWTPQWTTLLRIQPSRSTCRSWSVEHSRWLNTRAFWRGGW